MEQHLSYYKIFYEVAKAGNISKAAKKLYISQPAISKSISKLEDNLEINLFSRNSRGVTLTTEGRLLFEHVEAAFNSILLGEEQLKKAKELNIGKLKIGASSTLSKMLLIPYLNKFIAKYPQVNINLSSQSSTQTINMLESGILDLGLIAKPANKRSFSFLPLMDIHDIFVASPAYLKKLNTDDASQALISGNVILLDNENATRTYLNDYLYTNSINISSPLEVSTMDLIIDFAKIGIGIGCVIKEFVKEELKTGELIELKLEKNIRKRTVGFAYLCDNPNPTIKTFLEI